jgi:TetR/AcrR family transcriptional repressor of mexJK operon
LLGLTSAMSSKQVSVKITRESPKCRILSAARDLFFSKGVAAVTTDMLAKEAKTSKMTLYKYFANKEQILKQVVAEDVSRIFTPLQTDIADAVSYSKVLFEFCKNLVDIIFDPEIVRFDQLMVSQALTHQDLTKTHYNRTFQPTIDRVELLIELGQKKKYISNVYSAKLLTDILISSISGLSYTRAMHGFEDAGTVSDSKIKEILQLILGVDISKLASRA